MPFPMIRVSQKTMPNILLLDLLIAMRNTPMPPNMINMIGTKNLIQQAQITSWITAEMKKTKNLAPKAPILPFESLTASL